MDFSTHTLSIGRRWFSLWVCYFYFFSNILLKRVTYHRKHRCQMKRNWYEDSETTKFVTLHKLNQQLRTEIVRIDSVNQNLTNLVRMYENKCLALTLKLGRGKGNVGHRVRSKLLQSDAIQRTIAYMEQVNRIVMSKSAPNQGVSIPTMTMSSVRSGRIVRSATVIRKMCAQLLRPFQQQIEKRDVLLKNILLRDYVARLRRIKNKQTNSKLMRRRSKCLVMAPAASASKEDVGKRNTKATNGHNNLTKTYPIDSEIVRQGRSVRHEMIMRKNISTVVNAPIVVTCQTMSRCSI